MDRSKPLNTQQCPVSQPCIDTLTAVNTQGPDSQPFIDTLTALNTQGPDSQPCIDTVLTTEDPDNDNDNDNILFDHNIQICITDLQ